MARDGHSLYYVELTGHPVVLEISTLTFGILKCHPRPKHDSLRSFIPLGVSTEVLRPPTLSLTILLSVVLPGGTRKRRCVRRQRYELQNSAPDSAEAQLSGCCR